MVSPVNGKLKAWNGFSVFLIFLLALAVLCAYPVAAEENLTQEPTGQIQVSTVPNGSEIYINEAYVGKTPALLTDVPAGYYELVLKGNGYDDSYEKVYVRAGETAVIFRNLGVKKGVISVSSDPSGAGIYLDGKYMGATPYVFEAEVGAHTLELKKNWYGRVSQEVSVSYDEPLVLEAKMHINLLFSAVGAFFILLFVLFAKKYPELLRVRIPGGGGKLKKYGKGPGWKGRKEKTKKKFWPGSKAKSELESESEFGPESGYLVDLEKLPEPEFKYRRESRKTLKKD